MEILPKGSTQNGDKLEGKIVVCNGIFTFNS